MSQALPSHRPDVLGRALRTNAWVQLGASDKRLLLASLRSIEVATRPGGPPTLDSLYDWAANARENQREPADYLTWLLLAGRGFGKTRTAAETVRSRAARSTPARPHQIAVIGRNATETRDVCFDSPKSGLLSVFPPEDIVDGGYQRSLGNLRLTLRNGCVIRGFSGEEPDSLVGNAFDYVWIDEWAVFNTKTAQDVYDQAWLCLREATDPAVIISTTPRRLKHVRDLVRAATEPDSGIVITRGTIWDNAANLSAAALRVLERQYGGTRLGRQELGGELLADVEGALIAQSDIDAARILIGELPQLALTVTAVDPATTAKHTSDETGIVTIGVDGAGEGYVLDDASDRFSPDGWARAVWQQTTRHSSQVVVVEDNAGGDMVEHVLLSTWAQMTREARAKAGVMATRPPIVRVHPSGSGQGKWARALPIAALYQQGRIHHVNDVRAVRSVVHPDGRQEDQPLLQGLEDQATTWQGKAEETSPDRVDALVHGLTWALYPQRRASKGKAKAAVSASATHRWSRPTRR